MRSVCTRWHFMYYITYLDVYIMMSQSLCYLTLSAFGDRFVFEKILINWYLKLWGFLLRISQLNIIERLHATVYLVLTQRCKVPFNCKNLWTFIGSYYIETKHKDKHKEWHHHVYFHQTIEIKPPFVHLLNSPVIFIPQKL